MAPRTNSMCTTSASYLLMRRALSYKYRPPKPGRLTALYHTPPPPVCSLSHQAYTRCSGLLRRRCKP